MQGLAGHGSAPDLGVNAVEVALSYVARLQELREVLKARAPEGGRFDPPWTTINIGALHGGVAHNVIAGHAVLDWEMRPVQPGDAEFVKADLARLVEDTLLPRMRARHPDSFIETEVIGEVAGLVPVPDNPARDLVARITGANGADVVAFGTEAGLFQAAGMSAVICGPGSIAQAHKPDEFVALSELERCLDLLHGLADAVT
jgi:acetylornithine deacetylase